MKDETFIRLANGVIERIGDEIRKQSPRLEWKENWKDALRDSYEIKRQEAHAKLNHTISPSKLNRRIDRHKVGAALALAILEQCPLRVPILQPADRYAVIDYFANEVLAFKTAIQVIIQFARLPGCFVYPQANDGYYLEHTYKALYHARQDGKLDILMLANLLFVLESYHRLFTSVVRQP